MILSQIIEKLEIKALNNIEDKLKIDVTNCYTSDLLSDVMGKSKENELWITLQTHHNIIAVASLKDHAAIIITGSNEVSEESISKATEEGVLLLNTELNNYQISGALSKLLS